MRVLIAGAGRAGLAVAVHLRGGGHDVTLIERDASVAARAAERHGVVTIAGDATEASLLREAELSKADIVVAMLRRDADNLAVALLARAAGVSRVLVRMRDPEYRSVYEAAGVQRILSEIDVFIGALATAIEHDAVRHSMLVGSGNAIAFSLSIPASAAVVGRTVSEIASDPAYPGTCVFAGMWEPDGSVDAPRGHSQVRAEMTVLLVARRDELGRAIAFFTRAREKTS